MERLYTLHTYEGETVMNYSALIQNRKSTREYSKKKVPASILDEMMAYYQKDCHRLLPGLKTELLLFGTEAQKALEGAAGYREFLIGAPQYMILLSDPDPLVYENAGFIMEDMILKAADLDLGSCWLTFTDSEQVKRALNISSDMIVAAIAAFGYAQKSTKRLRLNIFSMSNVDIKAKRQYFAPKKGIYDMVFMDSWGEDYGLDEYIGFYDDMLWEGFYAAVQSPSYLNRQPYGFVLHDHQVTLVRQDDPYTTVIDGRLGLGVVMLHFTAVVSNWTGKVDWTMGENSAAPEIPADCHVVASCRI